MTIINKRRSYSRLVFFTFICALVGIIMGFDILLSNEFDINSILPSILEFVFCILPCLYFIDVFLWHYFGKEIIEVKDTELIIRKQGRLFKKKKIIQIHQIKDIYFWQKVVRDYHIIAAIWFSECQGALCIEYKRNREFYMGVNMNKREADELLEKLIENIPYLRQIKEGENNKSK